MKTKELVDRIIKILKTITDEKSRQLAIRQVLKEALEPIVEKPDSDMAREHATKIIGRLAQRLNLNIDKVPREQAVAQVTAALYPSVLSPLAKEYGAREDLGNDKADSTLFYPSLKGK